MDGNHPDVVRKRRVQNAARVIIPLVGGGEITIPLSELDDFMEGFYDLDPEGLQTAIAELRRRGL